MTPERFQRLKAIFDGALAQPIDQRRAWIEQACGGDAALLRDAQALLASHDSAGDFLEAPAQLDPADLDPLPEGSMLGAYRIVREIGRGGMGIVYLAQDNLARNVAIKTLPPALAASHQLRERLRREAHAAATIKHAAVATIYLLSEIDGHLVIVSEYVEGDTLRALLARGPIDSARAYAIACDIAGALAAAHEARVIHRDLKPENVIVTPSGAIKVVDFGIAHIEAPEPSKLTVPGMMLGTPAYMAPEQLLGNVVTPAADIYSFGIVFDEMLTGRHPLARGGSASPGTSAQPNPPYSSRFAQPNPPYSSRFAQPNPPYSARFAAIIERCTRVDPNERYASGRELLGALSDGVERTAPKLREGGSGPLGAPEKAHPTNAVSSPRWWWEFHQAITAIVYWVMTWPAWIGREIIGGRIGRALFFTTLIAVIVAANLRLHLWFTSRFYPGELRWARRRAGPWIRTADWLLVASLAMTGILVGEDRSPVAVVLLAVAVGATIAFLIIERATARAAFRNSATPRP